MTRIRIIHPVSRNGSLDGSLPELPAFVDVETDWLPNGLPASIECRQDKAAVQPAVLDRVRAAMEEGVDGIVINCFMDPGLEAAREVSPVPVAGPAQSAMTLALSLGQSFSVILPAESGEPIVRRQARDYVGSGRLASVRSVAMPVAELENADRLVDALVTQAERAIEQDGAEVVILGCTGMSYATDRVRRRLSGRRVPILDPTLCAVGAVLAQTIQSVSHSSLGYRLPEWREQRQGDSDTHVEA